jgi:hypothetical protein
MISAESGIACFELFPLKHKRTISIYGARQVSKENCLVTPHTFFNMGFSMAVTAAIGTFEDVTKRPQCRVNPQEPTFKRLRIE